MLEKMMEQIRYHFFTREFILFVVIGTFNTFNCSFIAWMITQVIPNSNVAFNIGYLLCNILAYVLNCKVVFFEPMTMQRYIKFFVSYIPNYIIQNVIVVIFYNMMGFPDIASFVIAAILGVPVTFLFVKIFAFGKK